MQTEYSCKSCNYSTQDRRNFFRHQKAKKHLKYIDNNKKENVKEEINKKLNTIIKCEYCSTEFKYKNNYYRHRKICSEKEIIYKDNIIKDNIIKEKDIELEKCNKAILNMKLEHEIQINKILTECLNKSNALINDIIDIAVNAQNNSQEIFNK